MTPSIYLWYLFNLCDMFNMCCLSYVINILGGIYVAVLTYFIQLISAIFVICVVYYLSACPLIYLLVYIFQCVSINIKQTLRHIYVHHIHIYIYIYICIHRERETWYRANHILKEAAYICPPFTLRHWSTGTARKTKPICAASVPLIRSSQRSSAAKFKYRYIYIYN